MVPPRPPTRRLVLAARAALIANIGIVVTGGIVRVTGSGLGCPDWPTCDGSAVAPVPGAEHAGWRAGIEFGNRLLTFVVLAATIAVVVALVRSRPHPRGIEPLAWALPAGVLFQAVLGGVTVLTGLSPLIVAGHFLASMVLIAIAVALLGRLRATGAEASAPTEGASALEGTPPLEVADGLRHATTALVVVAAVVLVLGTLVTGSGPHSGDPSAARLPLDIRLVAIAHADAVWLLIGLTVASLFVARRIGPPVLARALAVLLTAEIAQGGVGYLQYWLGIPPTLVSLHILGAALLWAQVVHVRMLTARPVVARAEVERSAAA
jgi:cytochrome c oxidase assembly protein subunit 15